MVPARFICGRRQDGKVTLGIIPLPKGGLEPRGWALQASHLDTLSFSRVYTARTVMIGARANGMSSTALPSLQKMTPQVREGQQTVQVSESLHRSRKYPFTRVQWLRALGI